MGTFDRVEQSREGEFVRLVRALAQRPTPTALDALRRFIEQVGDMRATDTAIRRLVESRVLAVAVLGDSRWPTHARAAALQRLGRDRDRAVIEHADSLADAADPVLRSELAEQLADFEAPEAEPLLERLLFDPGRCGSSQTYWRVMDTAAAGLARQATPPESLTRWLDARIMELDSPARSDAAVSLGQLRHPAAVEALVELARRGDTWARELLLDYTSDQVARAIDAIVAHAPDGQRPRLGHLTKKSGIRVKKTEAEHAEDPKPRRPDPTPRTIRISSRN